jgi:hypothetical protein
MNYRIVGQDGKPYGPVTAETIREWLAQGRVDSRTPIHVEGAAEWTFVGLLPEFSTKAAPVTPAALRPDFIPAQKTNGFATAGFICGLLSCIGFCCCACVPVSLLGIIFSIIAMVQIKSSPEPQNGWGLALAGLICSVVGLIVDTFIGLINGLVGALSDPALKDIHVNWN